MGLYLQGYRERGKRESKRGISFDYDSADWHKNPLDVYIVALSFAYLAVLSVQSSLSDVVLLHLQVIQMGIFDSQLLQFVNEEENEVIVMENMQSDTTVLMEVIMEIFLAAEICIKSGTLCSVD